MRDVDLAYAAGFIDGEGHIDWSNGSPVLNASQISPAPLEFLQALFGGKINWRPSRRNGCYIWSVYGDDAVRALDAIEQYLIVKAPDAAGIRERLADRQARVVR